jgi:hypothetical protein
MSVTEDNVHARLKKHYDRLWDSAFDGYEAYRKYPDRTLHRKTTRANIVNDLILAKAIQEFDEVPRVKLVEERRINLRLLKIEDNILLWFKKMDSQHNCQIFPTEHAKLLQAGQLSLFPGADVLVVGYLLNPEETRVSRVSIAKPAGIGKSPEWFIDLYANEKIVKLPVGSLSVESLSQAPSSASGRLCIIRSSQLKLA